MAKMPRSSWETTSRTHCSLITGVLVVAGIIFAEPIVRLLVKPEYAANAMKLELTVMLTRIMMPFLTFIALAAAAMGMLNALRHFFIPALSPAMFNVVSIAGAIGLIPVMMSLGFQPITASAIGTMAGDSRSGPCSGRCCAGKASDIGRHSTGTTRT